MNNTEYYQQIIADVLIATNISTGNPSTLPQNENLEFCLWLLPLYWTKIEAGVEIQTCAYYQALTMMLVIGTTVLQ